MALDLSRRNFLVRAGAFVACAPAIVSASSLMPVKAFEVGYRHVVRTGLPPAAWRPLIEMYNSSDDFLLLAAQD